MTDCISNSVTRGTIPEAGRAAVGATGTLTGGVPTVAGVPRSGRGVGDPPMVRLTGDVAAGITVRPLPSGRATSVGGGGGATDPVADEGPATTTGFSSRGAGPVAMAGDLSGLVAVSTDFGP